MNGLPIVSVLMSVYNCEDYIEESVQSILNQTFKNFEFIILDDGSTDDTVAFIESIKDSRIRLIRNAENKGLVYNLNRGIELAKGKYIARMDGDDVTSNTRLEKLVNFLDKNDEVMVCGTWLKFLGTDQIIEFPENDENIRLALLYRSAVAHATTMFRKRFFVDHNIKYSEEFSCAEDYHLWITLAGVGQMASIPEVLYEYRMHSNQLSKTRREIQERNSNKCRVELVKKLLEVRTDQDDRMAEVIFDMNLVIDQKSLSDVLDWINKIKEQNDKKHFFSKGFGTFIKTRKAACINAFYKNREKFHPGIFGIYLKTFAESKRVLTLDDTIRLFLKCMLFYKTSGSINDHKSIYNKSISV